MSDEIITDSLAPRQNELSELLDHCSEQLKEKWLQDSHDLLTAACVPQWVEVESMPGNSLPHRLLWYLIRRKDVSEAEAHGECPELNAMDAKPARTASVPSDLRSPSRFGEKLLSSRKCPDRLKL